MRKLHHVGDFMLVFSGVILLLRYVEAGSDSVNTPRVALTTGWVEGVYAKTVLGRPFFSFRGIPYATPPLGALRFKAPQPPTAWSEVLSAVEEPPACLQPSREVEYPIRYSEDCLYLNVYTPYLEFANKSLMPVIVWIHGGKYFRGSGSTYKYGPDFFLTKDVVIVSVNYRLGVFGFLNLNISEAQGNAALKDTVAALKWVKKEISKFGGDPDSVTIVGGSSGAGDVNFLYISPMAKGLFAKAVSHSGSALCAWSFLPTTVDLGLVLAHSLGCPTHSSQAAVYCLRNVSGSVLAEQQMMLEGVYGLENPFVPSIEAALGEEVFLTDSPQKMILESTGNQPYILGVLNGEGQMFINSPYTDPDQFANIDKDLVSYLPDHMLKKESPQVLKTITSRIKSFYMGNYSSVNNTMYGFVDFLSDKQFSYCVLKTTQIISKKAPVYLYYFTFEGEFQVKTRGAKLWNISGVCHGDELGYFFYRNYTIAEQNNLSAFPRDMDMVGKMITLWTSFAAYGNPTPISHSELNITWKPVEGDLANYLELGEVLRMNSNPSLKERTEFWDGLYKLILSDLASIGEDRFYMPYVGTVFLLFVSMFTGIAFIRRMRQYEYNSF